MAIVLPGNSTSNRFGSPSVTLSAQTVWAWVLRIRYATDDASRFDAIVTTTFPDTLQILHFGANQIRMSMGNSGAGIDRDLSSLVDGQEIVLAGTYDDGADEIKFYVDGVQEGITESTPVGSLQNILMRFFGVTTDNVDMEFVDFGVWVGDKFTESELTSFVAKTIAIDGFTPAAAHAYRPVGDGITYEDTVADVASTSNLTHFQGPVDTDNFPVATAEVTGPVISSVASSSGANTVTLNESITIVVDDNTGITIVTANAVALTNIVLDGDGITVTADVGLGVDANIGTSVNIVVDDGVPSAGHAVTVFVPTGFSSVTSAVAFAGLFVDSPFSGEAEFSSLGIGDVLVYDNLSGTLVFDDELIATLTPLIIVNTDGDGWFLDLSDSYKADLEVTTITHLPQISSLATELNLEGLWSIFLKNRGFITGGIESRRRAWLNNQLAIDPDTRISIQGLWLQFLDGQGITSGHLDSRLKSYYETQLAQTFPKSSLTTVKAIWLKSMI